jgi:hypothetical protein
MKIKILIITLFIANFISCSSTATKSELAPYRNQRFVIRSIQISDFQSSGGFKTPQLTSVEIKEIYKNLPLGSLSQFYSTKYGITLDTAAFQKELSGNMQISDIAGQFNWNLENKSQYKNGIDLVFGIRMMPTTKLSFSGIETRVYPFRTYTLHLYADGKKVSTDTNSYGVVEPRTEERDFEKVTPLVSKQGEDQKVFLERIKNYEMSVMFNTEFSSWLNSKMR